MKIQIKNNNIKLFLQDESILTSIHIRLDYQDTCKSDRLGKYLFFLLWHLIKI